MNLEELIALLKTLGNQVAYHHFHKPPDLPFIVINETRPEFYKADNTHYYTVKAYDISYYFEKKDPAKEQTLENLFLANDIDFDVTEDIYIEKEQMYYKIYEVKINGK
ncbi:hypothetical protein ACV7JQ_07040 [Globicatella sulfidifaciens]